LSGTTTTGLTILVLFFIIISKAKDLKNIISIDGPLEIFKHNGLIFNRGQVLDILDFMDKIAKLLSE
jgi:hypothetical protein